VYSVEQEALGRGINVVIVNSRTKSVIKMEHFDTYEFSKSQFSYLSIWVSICKNVLLFICRAVEIIFSFSLSESAVDKDNCHDCSAVVIMIFIGDEIAAFVQNTTQIWFTNSSFVPVLCLCWLGDRKGIWPLKYTYATYFQRFSFGAGGGREPAMD